VLKHSIEMSFLAGIIAKEIGADVRIAKTAALLHDIGKAVTHEMEGGHHHIGQQLAEQYGMEEAICHAIGAHHDDVEATTPEALIVRVVDALSAGRPGARGDTLENYAKRMTELENIANTFEGINKSYAISAGRELRVIVQPDKIDDLAAVRLARDIATKIESTIKFPGVIKVNVIRETRATEYAK
jgi:ribonuclease Y